MCTGQEDTKNYQTPDKLGYLFTCLPRVTVRLPKPSKMLKLFKRASKIVNDDNSNELTSIVDPADKRELLIRYVGTGTSEQSLNEIFEKSTIGKYCRITVEDKYLLVSELTDVEVVRISGIQIKRCLHDPASDKLCNCVAVFCEEESSDASCYLFETCSVKEVSCNVL